MVSSSCAIWCMRTFGSPIMSSLYFLMNAIAMVLAGLAIIYVVSKIWGWLFPKHDRDRK